MIYITEVNNNARVITAKLDAKYYPAIKDDKFEITLPLSLDNGKGTRGYKPIKIKFISTEKSKKMQFAIPLTMDHISAVEILIKMAEQTLENLI